MGSMLIIVNSPGFDSAACIVQRHELVHVQAFVPQAPVKAFYVAIFSRLSGMNEIELHAILPRPFGLPGFSMPRFVLVFGG